MDQKETLTPENQALYAGLLTTQVVASIQQARVDDHMSHETYQKLFEIAVRADEAVQKLVEMLESEGQGKQR